MVAPLHRDLPFQEIRNGARPPQPFRTTPRRQPSTAPERRTTPTRQPTGQRPCYASRKQLARQGCERCGRWWSWRRAGEVSGCSCQAGAAEAGGSGVRRWRCGGVVAMAAMEVARRRGGSMASVVAEAGAAGTKMAAVAGAAACGACMRHMRCPQNLRRTRRVGHLRYKGGKAATLSAFAGSGGDEGRRRVNITEQWVTGGCHDAACAGCRLRPDDPPMTMEYVASTNTSLRPMLGRRNLGGGLCVSSVGGRFRP